MKQRFMLTTLAAVAMIFFISGCAATTPKPATMSRRPTLMYQPSYYQKLDKKYPLKLGVLTVRDKRVMPFYTKDDYFQETIPDGVSDMIYTELKASGMFEEVKRIKEISPERISQDDLFRIQLEHGVDLIFIADLTAFNMIREKTGVAVVDTFKITVDTGITGQLIYLDKAIVIWADSVSRQVKELAKSGALVPSELGRVSTESLKTAIEDMKKLIFETGKRMRTS